MAKASGGGARAFRATTGMTEEELKDELLAVDAELADLRRRMDETSRRGAALADEQRRRLALGEDRESIDLPSGSFRALYPRNG